MHKQYWVYETKIKSLKRKIYVDIQHVYERWAKTRNGKQSNNCVKAIIGVWFSKR